MFVTYTQDSNDVEGWCVRSDGARSAAIRANEFEGELYPLGAVIR